MKRDLRKGISEKCCGMVVTHEHEVQADHRRLQVHLPNGVYIAAAWFSGDRNLDTPKLLAHGANPVTIGRYCLLTIGFGYVGFRRHCIRVLSSPTANATTRLDGNVNA